MSASGGDNGGGGGESGEGRRSEVTLNGMPTVHAYLFQSYLKLIIGFVAQFKFIGYCIVGNFS